MIKWNGNGQQMLTQLERDIAQAMLDDGPYDRLGRTGIGELSLTLSSDGTFAEISVGDHVGVHRIMGEVEIDGASDS